MSFCVNCGEKLLEGAKFCPICGNKIETTTNVKTEQRKIVFDGEIHKCPYCGEPLMAFETTCSHCKKEIRGLQGASVIQEFALKLEKTFNEEQKISLIKNFHIPNTKEDIFEFMILASSNFDAQYYTTHLEVDDISDAWLVKIEQCYQKSKLALNNNDLYKITELYTQIKTNIKRNTSNKIKINTIGIFSIVVGILLVMLTSSIPNNSISSILSVPAILFIVLGIVALTKHKKQQNKVKEKTSVPTQASKGFKNWSTISKVLWIILNIYTMGFPALIYLIIKK